MKKSTKPTEYLLIHATCSNEYTDCNSCLVKIPEGQLEIWKERLCRVEGLASDTEHFIGAEWLYSDVCFLTYDIEEELGEEICWVKLRKGDIEKYDIDERTDAGSMHITSHGVIYFNASGKYSGDHYETLGEVVINEL